MKKINGKLPAFICEFKNRTPNPGVCSITSIDFEKRTVDWSNGAVSSIASFDDITIKQFMGIEHGIKTEEIYATVTF